MGIQSSINRVIGSATLLKNYETGKAKAKELEEEHAQKLKLNQSLTDSKVALNEAKKQKVEKQTQKINLNQSLTDSKVALNEAKRQKVEMQTQKLSEQMSRQKAKENKPKERDFFYGTKKIPKGSSLYNALKELDDAEASEKLKERTMRQQEALSDNHIETAQIRNKEHNLTERLETMRKHKMDKDIIGGLYNDK